MSGYDWEALFVDDDSPDGTADAVNEVAQNDPRIKCLRRIGARGLSSACIEGILASSTPLVAVIDGDRQHDTAILPQMIKSITEDGAEIAIGSRYMEGGSMDGWSMRRKAISSAATYMSKYLIPEGLTDPMSGFFVIRRDVFTGLADRLSGKGFKILLDIFASADRELTYKEVPYEFRQRESGESKLSPIVVMEFAEMLITKTIGRYLPAKFLLFVGAGTTGMIVHFITLGLLFRILGVDFAWSQMTAILLAMTCNFYVNNIITYRERTLRGWQWLRGLITFYIACGLGAFVNFSSAFLLFENGFHWAAAGFIGAALGAIWNYLTTKTVTWRERE